MKNIQERKELLWFKFLLVILGLLIAINRGF